MARNCSLILLLLSLSASSYGGMRVHGKLLGADGQPMLKARVLLTYPSDSRPIRSVAVEGNGDYTIEIDTPGLWTLHFIGMYHHEYTTAVYVHSTKDTRIDVTLPTYNYATRLTRAALIGNFNEWSLSRLVYLREDQDSTYSAVVNSKSDTVLYRLVNVNTGGDIEGTDADGCVPNGIEGFTSFLVGGKGNVRIVFDPRKLPRANESHVFKITTGDSLESGIARSFAIFENTRDAYRSSLYWHVAELRMGDFKFNFKPVIDSVKNLLGNEPDGLIKQVLRLDYFGLIAMSSFTHYVDVKPSRETLTGIPPNSVVWSLDPDLLFMALNQASYNPYEKEEYIGKVLASNPMERTKAVLLSAKIDLDFHSLQYDQIPRDLTTLLDQYGDTPEAISNGQIYSGNYVKIKDGVRAPDFSVKSLSNPAQEYSSQSLKGKYYILYFWSTLNPVSEDEIENMQRVCEKYGKKNLAVVSISLDSTRAAAEKFLKKHLKLPWLNAFSRHGLNSKLCRDFEVYSIPKAILVDPNGTIRGEGWAMRRRNLADTLRKILGD